MSDDILQMLSNNTQRVGQTHATNQACIDFYNAVENLKLITKDFTLQMADMSEGVRSLTQQQIFVINTTGYLLQSLGLTYVIRVLHGLATDACKYCTTHVDSLNKMIDEDPEAMAAVTQINALVSGKSADAEGAEVH